MAGQLSSWTALAIIALSFAGCIGSGSSLCRGEDAASVYLRPEAPREEVRAAFVADGWRVNDSATALQWAFSAEKAWNDSVSLTATVAHNTAYAGAPEDKTVDFDHVAIRIGALDTRTTDDAPVARVEDVAAQLLAQLRAMGLANDRIANQPPSPGLRDWECIHGD